MSINILDNNTINKIAAGEDRPTGVGGLCAFE